ncbi:MAG TPA: polyprenyl synthetase family protein [Thermoanaerobaculia bacterium]|nr:polyprenyl synthetase family protein [Thermoanaerobaculia bacterium]
MSETLEKLLASVQQAVDARLPELLAAPEEARDDAVDPLPPAVREALLSPGKRFRPGLVYLVGELFEAPAARLLDPACAVEMIHAASLALDDLPSMDDAVTRRGRPALHMAHGEDMTILAAVALVARAFGILAERALHPLRDGTALSATAALDAVARLAEASGLAGLASGQALDLRTAPEEATFDRLETIHARKTGALFVAAAELGAVLGHARQKELAAVRSYARNVGLAFQIVDDLLEKSSPKETGKEARRAPAPTFARHIGEEGSRRLVGELTDHAVEALAPFGKRGARLSEFARMLEERKR